MTELNDDQKKLMAHHKSEYDRKLKTFSLDVAARIPAAGQTVDSLLDAAEKICDYITKSPKDWPIPSPDEAASEVAHLEAKGEKL